MTALSDRLVDAKGDRSIDSIVGQAESAGHEIDRSTVARYVAGNGAKRPPDHVLRALAAGLGIDIRELRQLAGMPAGELGPWTPPDESARLSRDQRRALDQLVKAIVTGSEEAAHVAKPTNLRHARRERMHEVPGKAAQDTPRSES